MCVCVCVNESTLLFNNNCFLLTVTLLLLGKGSLSIVWVVILSLKLGFSSRCHSGKQDVEPVQLC